MQPVGFVMENVSKPIFFAMDKFAELLDNVFDYIGDALNFIGYSVKRDVLVLVKHDYDLYY